MPQDKKKKADDPSTTSMAWDKMAPTWDMIETLLEGTEAMRAAGDQYLPRHPEESTDNYDERLSATTLFNMLELTLNHLVGKPFSDAVKLGDDVPQQIVDLADDIDLQGNDITVFARNWFREGLAKSFAHVLIDMPVLTDEDREGRTREDDLREGRRPYWLLIKPENLIAASATVINGQEVLTHVRIKETVVERVGFTEVERERIRVLEPGLFQVWELIRDKRKKPVWTIVEEGETGLDIIPLVTFYSNHAGLMTGKAPLEDLAHLNIRHWQSTSDQINVLTVARFPMLAVAGASDQTGSVMAIGPKQLLGTKDPQGRFYYVEHTGKAIQAGVVDLEKLEMLMSSYGAEFLKRLPGNPTATARALDSAEASSPLQDHIIRFIDSMNTVMSITAKWLRIESGGTVKIATDFGPEEVEDIDLRTLNEARRNRDLSRAAYLRELVRRGALVEDFSFEENLDDLTNEQRIESPFATGRNVPEPPTQEEIDAAKVEDAKKKSVEEESE